jgi:diguanylate cyclase (GGDEF)-like protein
MSGVLNVLLVDDSEDDYIITRDLFFETQNDWANLEWVTSYEDGLERMGHRCHDVYILDYYLGEHTGVELLEWAVEHEIHAPVIILTGRKDRDLDLLAMKAGAAEYLVKGRVDATLLEHTVRYATEHAHRLEALRELTIRDELTGLYNRREMDRLLAVEVMRCRRYAHPLSLIIMDIDNFKFINDSYGHATGDNVLRSIAQLLSAQVRSPDSIARYGGDELALILPETTERTTLLVAERMQLAIATHDFSSMLPSVLGTGPLPRSKATISMGVACSSGGVYTAEDLFVAADEALYEAKRGGRNRIVASSTLEPASCRA